MSETPALPFEDDGGAPERAAGETLVVKLDAFEGPLDLLLQLARTHKLDLAKLSMLDLARQYLTFIDEARRMKLEVAADYLVMAAWLAFLKSKLMLPKELDEDELSGSELAAMLAFRLKRLEAMRGAVNRLMNSKMLGRDVFARGGPEHINTIREPQYTATLYDLLSAYARDRQRHIVVTHTVKQRKVWSIKQARVRLEELIGVAGTWASLDSYFVTYLSEQPDDRSTVIASSFSATLEMAREGLLELRQTEPFAPLYVRARSDDSDAHFSNDDHGAGSDNEQPDEVAPQASDNDNEEPI